MHVILAKRDQIVSELSSETANRCVLVGAVSHMQKKKRLQSCALPTELRRVLRPFS